MSDNYWTRLQNSKTSRRRFLSVAGATGAGAAGLALVGCGDDDDTEEPSGASPTATTAAGQTPAPATVKRGGRYRTALSNDPPTLDPYRNLTFLAQGRAATVYSRLFKFKSGPDTAYAAYEIEPDLAEKYEMSGDNTTVTVTLRSDIKTHPVAPLSGRQFTSEDVKVSWERYRSTSQNAGDFKFVDSIETPDATTVIFKMATPSATLIPLLTSPQHFWVMPKEAGLGFDPEKVMIGTGPWVFKKYDVSQQLSVDRFAEWHGRGSENLPYLDGIDWFIMPEYTTRLLQFQGGNLDVSGVNANDLLDLQKDMPDAKISGEFRALMSFLFMSGPGGQGALGAESPFKDERVRRAISMAMDRDTISDVAYNVNKLKDAGFDARIEWNSTFMPAGLGVYWVDPKGSDMGEAAAYYEYNPNEAKKLLSEAGFPLNQKFPFRATQNVYGSDFDSTRDLTLNYLKAVGIQAEMEVEDYGSKYITQTFTGNFDGFAYGYQTPFTGPEGYMTRPFTENPANHSKILDPELIAMVQKQSHEFDAEARLDVIHDIQRYASEKMYYVAGQAGASQDWIATHPYVNNVADYLTAGYGPPTETDVHIWLDKA